jgi:hypothetical protein
MMSRACWLNGLSAFGATTNAQTTINATAAPTASAIRPIPSGPVCQPQYATATIPSSSTKNRIANAAMPMPFRPCIVSSLPLSFRCHGYAT